MNQDNQNQAIEGFNQGIVDRSQEEEQSQQAQIANALRQDVANQKLMAGRRDASRLRNSSMLLELFRLLRRWSNSETTWKAEGFR